MGNAGVDVAVAKRQILLNVQLAAILNETIEVRLSIGSPVLNLIRKHHDRMVLQAKHATR